MRSSDEIAREARMVYQYIEKHPGASRGAIMRKFGITENRLIALFASMEARGFFIGECDPDAEISGRRCSVGYYAMRSPSGWTGYYLNSVWSQRNVAELAY